jgi:hypothetical protein
MEIELEKKKLEFENKAENGKTFLFCNFLFRVDLS